MGKIKILFFVNILVFVVILGVLYFVKKSESEIILKKNYEMNKNILDYVLNTLSKRADLIYDLIIDKKVLKDVYLHTPSSREDLIKYLYPKYQIIKKYGVYQFHFHLPNAISFIRFHRLLRYGDYLGNIRKSVVLAQTKQKIIRGFEIGRVMAGYRNVYPLKYNNKIIGSVEISYGLKQIVKMLLNNSRYAFLLEKNSFDETIFPEIKVNYKQFKNFYVLFNNGVNLEIAKLDKKYSSFDGIVNTVLPIYDIKGKKLGYMVSQKRSKNLEIVLNNFKIFVALAVVVFLITNILLLVMIFYTKTKFYSDYDHLTEVLNRRGCLKRIKNFKKFGVILFDIDFFKKINDTYGHDVGDEVLRSIAKIVKSKIRKDDVFCRWGGEEFVLVFDNMDLDSLYKIAENIRESIEKYHFDNVNRVTVSVGIAVDEKFEKSLKKADENLYKAKKSGKNKVVK